MHCLLCLGCVVYKTWGENNAIFKKGCQGLLKIIHQIIFQRVRIIGDFKQFPNVIMFSGFFILLMAQKSCLITCWVLSSNSHRCLLLRDGLCLPQTILLLPPPHPTSSASSSSTFSFFFPCSPSRFPSPLPLLLNF